MDQDSQGATSTATAGSQGHSADATTTDGNGQEQWFLDVGTSKYRDKDAAAKGFSEKDKTISELKAQIEARNAALEAIGKRLGAQPEPQVQKRDIEAEMVALEKELEDADAKTQVQINRKIARLEAEQLVERQRAEVEGLRTQLSQLQKRTAEYDPEWVANRELVGRLSQELGLDPNDPKEREILTKIATKERAKTAQPPRVMPGGGVGRSSGSGGGERDEDDSALHQRAAGVAEILASIGLKSNIADLKQSLKRRQS